MMREGVPSKLFGRKAINWSMGVYDGAVRQAVAQEDASRW